MKLKVMVDKVGRLVLPEAVRKAIGVDGRMALTIEVIGNAARLSVPGRASGKMARKRGRLVYTGALPKDWDSGAAVIRTRERR